MNILGIDHGTKRVGLAVGSTETGLAAPLKTLEHRGDAELLADLKKVIAEEGIGQVVVGLPLAADGGHTGQEEIVRSFAASLGETLDIDVELEDERLSSAEIVRSIKSLGGRKAWKASGLDRDSAAATIFLQTYLDKLRTE